MRFNLKGDVMKLNKKNPYKHIRKTVPPPGYDMERKGRRKLKNERTETKRIIKEELERWLNGDE